MSFELHIPVEKKNLPVAISLRSRKAGVICFLSVSVDALGKIGGTEKPDKRAYDVLIGSGDDAGKMRVQAAKTGHASYRRMRNYLIFNLGIVPSLPSRQIDKQRLDAKAIDAATLEIVLPNWDALPLQDDEDEDERADGRADVPPPSRRAIVAPPHGAARPAKPASGAQTEIVRNGITLDVTLDEETITFGKKTMDISTRQAAVAAALLRAMPSNVGREWLCRNVLTDIPAHARDVSLDMIFRDLAKACSAVGLELKVTPKVGVMLVIA